MRNDQRGALFRAGRDEFRGSSTKVEFRPLPEDDPRPPGSSVGA
jgi:hypothetical protein